MAGSKNRRPTTALVERWIKSGYGQGNGATYKPYMFVRDIPSRGRSSMVQSPITGRTHHYLSTQELYVHLLAEYAPRILDIREQYALLPWKETQSIAARLGIKHPKIPGTQTPVVVTTDLLLSLRECDGTQLVAVCVKLTKDLSKRTLQKLLLERVYWNRRGIAWFLATEKNLPIIRARNLIFFENPGRTNDPQQSSIDRIWFVRRFEENWAADSTYTAILRTTCDQTGFSENLGHTAISAAIWRRQSRINIDQIYLKHSAPIILHPRNE